MFVGYFDGCSKNNPGEAGAGAYIVDYTENKVIWKGYKYLGIMTNNEAEYQSVILLLTMAKQFNISSIEVRGDSSLVVNQMNGIWKVKEPRMKALKAEAQSIMTDMKVTFKWVPREENSNADKLSNYAVERKEVKF
jgi:ribonuclease HI